MTFVIVCHFRSKAHRDKLSDRPGPAGPAAAIRGNCCRAKLFEFTSKLHFYYQSKGGLLSRSVHSIFVQLVYYTLSFFPSSFLIKNKSNAYRNNNRQYFHFFTVRFLNCSLRFDSISSPRMRYQRELAKIDPNSFIGTKSCQSKKKKKEKKSY